MVTSRCLLSLGARIFTSNAWGCISTSHRAAFRLSESWDAAFMSLMSQPSQHANMLPARHFSSTGVAACSVAGNVVPTVAAAAVQQPAGEPLPPLPSEAEVDELLQVLLHPMPANPVWNAQLSPYLVRVSGQQLLQPSAVLLSMLRALHVVRCTLQEGGHVYVVGAHKPHVPLIKAAARSCINPNVWWQRRAWIPGTLANYRSHAHLFKDAHQPNRRLFAAKGLRMVNPLCPSPGPLSAPPPRLSWDDKWLLFKRLRRPGFRRLLTDLQHAEDGLHRLRQAGSLRGVSRDLRLIIFLDTARSQVAVREAYHRHVPTIALVNTVADPEMVTYPILARDSHPGFTRFFLEWLVKVANAAPGAAPRELAALRAQFDQHASNTAAAVETSTPVELLKSDAAP